MSRHRHLSDILGHAEHNGLYRLDAPGCLEAPRIDGRRLTGKHAMLAALAEALAFPAYFGFNWDAAEECLADLGWLEGGVALVIEAADVPEAAVPDDWGVLLDLLADAAQFWQGQDRFFAVFLQGGHAAYPKVVA